MGECRVLPLFAWGPMIDLDTSLTPSGWKGWKVSIALEEHTETARKMRV